jgi:nucleoside-diphosphate-sugar epimerase
MKLLITGASGFLGRFVVAEAIRRGHRVRAIVRPASAADEIDALNHPNVEQVRCDLRSPAGLVEAVAGVDAVLHLAASKSGDMYAQYAGTVVATEHLLHAMVQGGVSRIIAVSSFAVYDYIRIRGWTRLSEESPLAPTFPPRDEYSHTKLVQEELIRDRARQHGWDFAILRPGAIIGPANLWTARLGISATPKRWLRIGWLSRVPISYVEHCAEAILLAAEKPGPLALTVNVVDDRCPTQASYCRAVLRRLQPRPRSVTIPWTAIRLLARAAALTNAIVFKGRAKLPSILVPARLHARFKPLRYSNQRLHETLGWTQRYTLAEAIDRSLGLAEIRSPEPVAFPSMESFATPEPQR